MSAVMVMYNAETTDAWCGAWLMDRCFNTVQLIPYEIGQPLPVIDNRTVFCIGIQFTEKQLDELNTYAHTAMAMDHDDRSKEVMSGRDYCMFDDSRSSCRLAYDWCLYRGFVDNYAASGWQNNRDIAKGMSAITMYVQDKELGRNKMPNTRHINLCIDSYDRELKQWDMLARRASVTPEALTNDGIAIDRYISKTKESHDTSEQDKG